MQNGQYLDSCILLGADSSYSASEHDKVYLVGGDEGTPSNSSGKSTEGVPMNSSEKSTARVPSQSNAVSRSSEFIIELQVKLLSISFKRLQVSGIS